jgi:hypothetical protein
LTHPPLSAHGVLAHTHSPLTLACGDPPPPCPRPVHRSLFDASIFAALARHAPRTLFLAISTPFPYPHLAIEACQRPRSSP